MKIEINNNGNCISYHMLYQSSIVITLGTVIRYHIYIRVGNHFG